MSGVVPTDAARGRFASPFVVATVAKREIGVDAKTLRYVCRRLKMNSGIDLMMSMIQRQKKGV